MLYRKIHPIHVTVIFFAVSHVPANKWPLTFKVSATFSITLSANFGTAILYCGLVRDMKTRFSSTIITMELEEQFIGGWFYVWWDISATVPLKYQYSLIRFIIEIILFNLLSNESWGFISTISQLQVVISKIMWALCYGYTLGFGYMVHGFVLLKLTI